MHDDNEWSLILLILGCVLIYGAIVDPRFKDYERTSKEFNEWTYVEKHGVRHLLSGIVSLAFTSFFITFFGKKKTRMIYIALGLLAIVYALLSEFAP